jgi:hypothetical protein
VNITLVIEPAVLLATLPSSVTEGLQIAVNYRLRSK